MFKLFVFAALLAVALAQFDRRLRPTPFRPTVTATAGVSDGRYTGDNSGRYNKNDGKYYPDDSGRYSGQNGKYNTDGSGKYSGQSDKYVHQDVGGGQYSGDKGSGAGGSGSGSRFGSGSAGFGASRPSSVGAGISAGAGFGAPVAQKTGSAAGLYDNRNYAILRQDGHVDEDGYHYIYETENGITGEEAGKLHNRGTEQEGMKAGGFYKYTGPDNVVYEVTYTADEDGFQAQGAHIPTPPPIPPLILRALEWQRQQGTL